MYSHFGQLPPMKARARRIQRVKLQLNMRVVEEPNMPWNLSTPTNLPRFSATIDPMMQNSLLDPVFSNIVQ